MWTSTAQLAQKHAMAQPLTTTGIGSERSEKTTVTTTSLIEKPNATASVIEKALIGGDLSGLSPADRVLYYNQVCESLGLNPLTKPFAYILLNGKLTLYALKDCTEQLRSTRSVSVRIMAREVTDDCYVVTAQASLPSNRQDESIGAVPLTGLKGEARANAMMKAETKAKRRVTLSICGLGMLDETEVESLHQPHVLVEAPGAPVATLQPTATLPPTQGGGDTASRPSGAEASGDAALSPDTLPEMVNHETGEVLLLPDGVVLITRVLAGKGAIKLSINHSGQLAGDNAIAIFKEQLATVATEVAQTHVPVRLEIAKSAKGNDYVKDIHAAPLPESWQANTTQPSDPDPAGHGEPVDLDQIPF